MPSETYYQMLFIDPCADIEIISRVYRLLAKRYHPDRDLATDAAVRMSELNDVFAVLSDPKRRASYDRSIGVSCPNRRASRVAIDVDGQVRSRAASSASPSEAASPHGEAGPPPAFPRPSGIAVTFGRYKGWTLVQIDQHDRNYLEWLRRTPNGRTYARELDEILSRPAYA
jgi:curved DNA-binding protein CbpA